MIYFYIIGDLNTEQSKCSVLFEMGNKFEDEVCDYLEKKY
ncbi:unnamed protein product, partial [marine sediment metagenome]